MDAIDRARVRDEERDRAVCSASRSRSCRKGLVLIHHFTVFKAGLIILTWTAGTVS